MTEEKLRGAMEMHGDRVYRLALCRLQNAADAEDVYQDVFLRLWGQAAEDWDAEHLKAWLLRTTLNRCTDLHCFRLRRQTLEWRDVPGAQLNAETADVWAAVAELPEKLRTAVHLHYAEGYSTEEIAAVVGCPAATVRTRLLRGREKLKELLGGKEHA